ncbi:MAG: hypothetical protein FD152_532 [Xanthobacteraceae bacterium]|nr:MAG: hypothetical protein FD152_532 [Xanthobacteraceae bacterium]
MTDLEAWGWLFYLIGVPAILGAIIAFDVLRERHCSEAKKPDSA